MDRRTLLKAVAAAFAAEPVFAAPPANMKGI